MLLFSSSLTSCVLTRNPLTGVGQCWQPDLVPAGRPQTWNRVFCPGEVQPSGHLRLQESRHLERLEPPGRRLHTRQGCVCFTVSHTQEKLKMSFECVFVLYFIPILSKVSALFFFDLVTPVAFRMFVSDVQMS